MAIYYLKFEEIESFPLAHYWLEDKDYPTHKWEIIQIVARDGDNGLFYRVHGIEGEIFMSVEESRRYYFHQVIIPPAIIRDPEDIERLTREAEDRRKKEKSS